MELSPTQRQQMDRLVDLFLQENARVNLSAFRETEQCFIGNVLDSLALIELLPTIIGPEWEREHIKILDLGTGGGFPLLPLALLLPNARFTGLDATQKKIDAVERIAKAMGIANVTFVARRAEDYAHKDGTRETFDLVLARAVAPIATLLEYSAPFAKLHAKCVFWKSMHVADELRESATASKLLATRLITSHAYTLPDDWGERQLLVYDKEARTSMEYPRRVGIPKSRPL